MKTLRKAFTMIELILVIVVMGIVGKYGIELLIQAYDYYIMNTAENRFQAQSEVAAEQVANRLQYRIPGSEIVRQSNGGLNNYSSLATTVDDNSNVTIIEWVGTDMDGWRGDGESILPTWSGFIDVEDTVTDASNAKLITPELNVTRVSNVITALSPKRASGVWNGTGLGLFFIQDSNFNVIQGFGWDGIAVGDQSRTVHRVNIAADNELQSAVVNFSNQKIYEFYKLSWTAYALEHNAATGELKLYYDYRPWNGENYSTNGSSMLLMENVDTFRFRSAGDAIKLQVCIKDRDLFKANTEEFSICKEKTVF